MAWNQEEFEARVPRSESLRKAQAEQFLEQFRQTARRIENYKKGAQQLELSGINQAILLDSLRRPLDPSADKFISIDDMKKLGLYVQETGPSVSLAERRVQPLIPGIYSSEQHIPSVKTRLQQIASTPTPVSLGRNRMAGKYASLLIPLITGASTGYLLEEAVDDAQERRAAELIAQAVS